MKILLILLYALILAGCATGQAMKGTYDQPVTVGAPTVKEFDTIPPPALGKVVVAVYNFTDKTGQRKAREGIADFSRIHHVSRYKECHFK